jgi:hypothetical protein
MDPWSGQDLTYGIISFCRSNPRCSVSPWIRRGGHLEACHRNWYSSRASRVQSNGPCNNPYKRNGGCLVGGHGIKCSLVPENEAPWHCVLKFWSKLLVSKTDSNKNGWELTTCPSCASKFR